MFRWVVVKVLYDGYFHVHLSLVSYITESQATAIKKVSESKHREQLPNSYSLPHPPGNGFAFQKVF